MAETDEKTEGRRTRALWVGVLLLVVVANLYIPPLLPTVLGFWVCVAHDLRPDLVDPPVMHECLKEKAGRLRQQRHGAENETGRQ